MVKHDPVRLASAYNNTPEVMKAQGSYLGTIRISRAFELRDSIRLSGASMSLLYCGMNNTSGVFSAADQISNVDFLRSAIKEAQSLALKNWSEKHPK